jgi:hypothetical protein
LQAPVARLPLARALEHLPSLRAAAQSMAETLAAPGTDLYGKNAVLNHVRDVAIS